MSRVTFTLEDEPDGLINMGINFEGGFNAESQAHKTAQMLNVLMGKIHGEQDDAKIEGRDPLPIEKILTQRIAQD
jgi:hypothetical protein